MDTFSPDLLYCYYYWILRTRILHLSKNEKRIRIKVQRTQHVPLHIQRLLYVCSMRYTHNKYVKQIHLYNTRTSDHIIHKRIRILFNYNHDVWSWFHYGIIETSRGACTVCVAGTPCIMNFSIFFYAVVTNYNYVLTIVYYDLFGILVSTVARYYSMTGDAITYMYANIKCRYFE